LPGDVPSAQGHLTDFKMQENSQKYAQLLIMYLLLLLDGFGFYSFRFVWKVFFLNTLLFSEDSFPLFI